MKSNIKLKKNRIYSIKYKKYENCTYIFKNKHINYLCNNKFKLNYFFENKIEFCI